MVSLWSDLAARAGIALHEGQHAQLSKYLNLLEAANARMNLTRIVDRADAELRHIGDALTVLPFLQTGSITLADVGSGGGVPGIPLAIVRPDAAVTLVEATKKKAAFLREAATELGLSNLTVVDERVENAARTPLRETCDVVTARAVATLDWLVEWCLPLLNSKGRLLAMKGERLADELPAAAAAMKLLRAAPPVIHRVELPGSEHRVIVQIDRAGKIHDFHPRPVTAAKGKPLR